jgi:hypothetical protein
VCFTRRRLRSIEQRRRKKTLEMAIVPGQPLIIILDECTFCDATFLSALVALERQLRDDLILIVPRKGILRRMLDMTKLSDVFNIHSLESALGHLSEAGRAKRRTGPRPPIRFMPLADRCRHSATISAYRDRPMRRNREPSALDAASAEAGTED